MSRLDPALRVLAVAAPALIAAVAQRAQTITAPEVFYGCDATPSATVSRIEGVDLEQECSMSAHARFSWADGAARPVTAMLGEVRTIDANTDGEATATCPAGSYAVGGGHQFLTFSAAQPVIRSSGPLLDPANSSWVVSIHNSAPDAVDVKVRAIARCTR